MAILLLSDVFPPKTGGSGRWFWELYRRMPRDAVLIAAGEHPRQQEFDRTHDLRVVRVPLGMPEWGIRSLAGLRGYGRVLRTIGRILSAEGIDQIHCGRCLPEGWVAWMIRRCWRIPYICYVHGEEMNTADSSREFRWMVQRVFRDVAFVVANSRNTARMLREHWGMAPARIRQLYPGVDATHFVPASRDPIVRSQLGWGDRPVVLTVGRLQKRKGHDQIVLALHKVRQSVPDVLYAIAGDGQERAILEAMVASEQLADHVQFLGEIDEALLIRCYQQCDLFVLPNRQVDGDFEGFGMVLLEAQACGKPVVAGASGGTAETMRIPETGQVVCCDGPHELAAVIVELLGDPALRERMGEAARRWAVEHFNWTTLSRQAHSLFGVKPALELSGLR